MKRILDQQKRLGLTHPEIAGAAGLSLRQWLNIRRTRRAFPRTIHALRYALRTIEKRMSARGELFNG